MTVFDPDSVRLLQAQLQDKNYIDRNDYSRFGVKRGLRNADGTGVMAGLTKICSVEGYVIDDGEKIPKKGNLFYRGVNVNDLVDACRMENRFGYEETAFLLLFGQFGSGLPLFCFLCFLVGREAQGQANGSLLVIGRQGEFHTRQFLHPLAQELHVARYLGVARVVGDAHSRTERKHLGGVGLHALWQRDNTVISALGHDSCRSTHKQDRCKKLFHIANVFVKPDEPSEAAMARKGASY